MSVSGRHRLLFVVPSMTSYTTFLEDVAAAWVRDMGEVAVAYGPALAGDDASPSRGDVSSLPLAAMRSGSIVALGKAAWALGTHIRRWRPHVIHAHFTAAVAVAATARLFGFGRDAVWAGTFHGLHATAGRQDASLAIGWVEAWASRRMSQVWVLNEEDRRYLSEHANVRNVDLLWPFGMGCDTTRFDAGRFAPDDRSVIRQEFGLADAQRVITYIGRQVEFKGYAATVRAFWRLQPSHPLAVLLLVGVADPAHKSGLDAEETARLANDPRIIRLGWRRDVDRVLAISDLTIFPSRREGMPVNVMESLASGVPVITTHSRGCRDLVRDGVDGIVLPVPDPASIARAVDRLLSAPELRAGMSQAAAAGAERFTKSDMVMAQLAAYRVLLGSTFVCAS